ncbi:MAG: NUDIX hydrolase [Bacteroidota bacterium]
MYEVFFNDSRLVITGIHEKEFLNNREKVYYLTGPESLPRIAEDLFGEEASDFTIVGNPDILWPAFRDLFTEIPAAGGVVRSVEGYLFIYRRGRWDLPKGKIDPGETPEEAALREVREETGLRMLNLVKPLPCTWHIYPNPQAGGTEKRILKRTYWFLMEATGGQPLIPEAGEDITEARWIKSEHLEDVASGTFRSLRGLIRGF